MSKKKVITIAVSVVLVAAAAALIVSNVAGGKKEETVAEVPPVVSAEYPELRSIVVNTELIGTIESDSIVYVTPKGAGEIISVNAQTGDQVTAGQLLCEIDTKQVEAARLTMETARVSYEDAKSNLDRYSVLHAAGDMAEADFQKLADNVELARLQYESAKLGYNLQLESSRVTAPISGRVESYNVKVHDMVSQQSQICVITGAGDGKAVTFYASERIVEGLKVGDALTVVKNGVDHAASITEVSSMVDPQSGLFKVKASVPDGAALATGTSVKLQVVSQRADNVLTVPVDAVYYEGGAPYIYTYGDGVLHKNAVTVGIADNSYIEVKEGINTGDQVVTTWTTEFYDGSKVTLSENQTSEDVTPDAQTEAEGQTEPADANQ
ncbi:MAG: efflux RND transporter periplasmic adaptor subunit [Clostridiales bacterium]|nr:efflux RND transporter periplasmic adaptor subunit [Clostridiales bacterium]